MGILDKFRKIFKHEEKPKVKIVGVESQYKKDEETEPKVKILDVKSYEKEETPYKQEKVNKVKILDVKPYSEEKTPYRSKAEEKVKILEVYENEKKDKENLEYEEKQKAKIVDVKPYEKKEEEQKNKKLTDILILLFAFGLFLFTLRYLLYETATLTGYYAATPNFASMLVIIVSIPYLILFYLIFRKNK